MVNWMRFCGTLILIRTFVRSLSKAVKMINLRVPLEKASGNLDLLNLICFLLWSWWIVWKSRLHYQASYLWHLGHRFFFSVIRITWWSLTTFKNFFDQLITLSTWLKWEYGCQSVVWFSDVCSRTSSLDEG